MASIDPIFLEPYPTMLEVQNLLPEATRDVTELLLAELPTPSYISRAIVKHSPQWQHRSSNGDDSSVVREDFVNSLTLALPLGAVFRLSSAPPPWDDCEEWTLSELSTCCVARLTFNNLSGYICSSCARGVLLRPMDPFSFTVQDENGEVIPLKPLEESIEARLESLDVDTLSATLMAAEIKSIMEAVLDYNRMKRFSR